LNFFANFLFLVTVAAMFDSKSWGHQPKF